jgi:ABC-type sugar transport system ATPase subunit
MARVTLSDVRKTFGGVEVVRGISGEIGDGEFVVLVGPSGCGKSTLLRMIAGLEDITSGTVAIDGEVVNDVPSKERDIAMVFQNYALYPHMTVAENMGFSLRLRGADRQTIAQAVAQAAASLEVGHLLDRYPPPALRGSAPARGDGAGHRAQPPPLSLRRASFQPRRQAPRPDAQRAARAARAPGRDLHLRHP